MNIRFPVLGVTLALVAVVGGADVAAGQADQTTQDSTRVMQRRGMRGQFGPGMHRGAMGAFEIGHVGPRMLLGAKEELGLSADQVARLEEIHESHHTQMQAQMERLSEHREAMRKARLENDWEALEKGIAEGAELRSGVARGMLNVERETLGVLSDEQRQKLETWQEGARLLRRQRMEHRRGMQGRQGRGMRMQRRRGSPPPSGQ